MVGSCIASVNSYQPTLRINPEHQIPELRVNRSDGRLKTFFCIHLNDLKRENYKNTKYYELFDLWFN